MSSPLSQLTGLLAACSARLTRSWERSSTTWKLLHLKLLQRVELRREHRHLRRQHRNRQRQLRLLQSRQLTEHRRQQLANLQLQATKEQPENSPLLPFDLHHLL